MPDTILITGSEGFLGKHLAAGLTEDGHRLFRLSRSLGTDITQPAAFDRFRDERIDAVVHLAGIASAASSWTDPAPCYAVNTLGTQRVLDFCREQKARLIYVSSYVYGRPRYLPIDELHPVAPANPYAHSKWLSEELCRFYGAAFGVATTIIRPFNVYGPGQSPAFVIPHIVDQWRRSGAVIVDDPEPKRDYLFVSDFVDACRIVYAAGRPGEVYNVGSGTSVSVAELLALLQTAVGRRVEWTSRGRSRPGEIPDVVCGSRLVAEGMWQSKVTLQDGLCRLLDAD